MGWKQVMMEKTERPRHLFQRMNQVVLVFPVWLVLGLSGLLRSTGNRDGWIESHENDAWSKMH